MTTAVTTTDKKPTLRERLESDEFKHEIARALPGHMKPDRMIRVAVTTMLRVPKLAKCDQASFFNAMLTLSQLGLEPDGRHAHLIPFENRKAGIVECQLIIDYKGLVKLIMQIGQVSRIHADVVREEDEFEYDRGSVTKHKPNFRVARGKVYAVYCIITMKDGTEKCEVMTRDDVEAIRKRSRSGSNGPWVTDWDEMAKKTVFRRASKWVPISSEKVALALEVDEGDVIDGRVSASSTRVDNSIMAAIAPKPPTDTASDDSPVDYTDDLNAALTEDALRELYGRIEGDSSLPTDEKESLLTEINDRLFMIGEQA